MVAGAVWTNLKDPDDSDLATVLPKRPHQIAVERLSQTEKYIEEAFPSLESHKSDSTDTYLFGELAFPVFDPEAESIGTISVRLVVDFDRLVTVIRTPEGLPQGVGMPDLSDLPSPGSDLEAGACMWLLLDRVAHEIRDLVKAAEVRAEQVEKPLIHDEKPPPDCRKQLAQLRNQFLQLGTLIHPTLSVVEAIIADELDLRDGSDENKRDLFTRDTEIHLISVRNMLRHALQRTNYWTDNLQTLQDSLSDYLNREQAKSGNRLAAVASIMLLPTFLVGLYGMNIDSGYFPEFGWLNGYLLAWILIVVITVVQVVVFRRKGWLSSR